MKQFLLVAAMLLFSFSCFSQNGLGNSASWNGSINNIEEKPTNLKIYPNPCKQSHVTIESDFQLIKEIQLTNITGKQVYSKKYTIPENKKVVRLEDFQNGMYLLKIKTSDNKFVVKKFIISKK